MNVVNFATKVLYPRDAAAKAKKTLLFVYTLCTAIFNEFLLASIHSYHVQFQITVT